MLRIIVASLLLVAVAYAAEQVCEARNGKNIITFSETPERTKFPCKYNALRATKCGKWKVTLSPGNTMEMEKMKRYVIKTMWVGVERISDGMKWEGRSDLKIARKYLNNIKKEPFVKKDGALSTGDVFTFGPRNADNKVTLVEKSGDFNITFGLYEPEGDWHKSSSFKFECFSSTFDPSDYPKQICGNGTKMEVREFKQAMDWTDQRKATLFHNVFTNMDIVQTDSDCLSAARAMTNKCKGDQQFEAARVCWPILGKPHIQRCISQNMDSPISAFRHCVEYVCSGYTDLNACLALSEEIDMCPQVPELSLKVRDNCKPDLFCN
ncbi:uncharacterized protein [Littorina saxatilis]|uniref:Uncharacterized protein n=1 Tax=Littorina saxatilis TaxID=31220 RepID=A0AAN9GG53_9CAEN